MNFSDKKPGKEAQVSALRIEDCTAMPISYQRLREEEGILCFSSARLRNVACLRVQRKAESLL
ncbi:MAG: hypothetical protein ACOX4Z_01920 [Desulfobulbus sp.]|jgi:hypothetical protein